MRKTEEQKAEWNEYQREYRRKNLERIREYQAEYHREWRRKHGGPKVVRTSEIAKLLKSGLKYKYIVEELRKMVPAELLGEAE